MLENGKRRQVESDAATAFRLFSDFCRIRDGTITGDVPEAKLKALEKSLAKNALTDGNYKPGRGFTFFHSIGDEVVPYCNFESVCNNWGVGGHLARRPLVTACGNLKKIPRRSLARD